MALLDKLLGKKPAIGGAIGDVKFAPIVKDKAREEGAYATWIRNHIWNSRNDKWSRLQMEKFTYKPTLGILVQCKNPRADLLAESLSSIFNQIYPFHELFIVDRGSSGAEVRGMLEALEKDPRVKVSFQKGTERDAEAIAKIMKKTESEWVLLMGAEDVLEPNSLYNMVATLQNTVEIDFVFADSDLIDDQGLRFAEQFKPVWAVGAHYPLGYYQHPILLHGRLVHKLRGHERVSTLMEEGTLLDDASNHSRYVLQAPGILYHARTHGSKNEIAPPPAWNVLINENYKLKGEQIVIDTDTRICSEPRVPLRLLWILDSLDIGDGELHLYYLARYFAKEYKHSLQVIASRNGALKSFYEAFAKVTIAEDTEAAAEKLQKENGFDAAFVSSLQDVRYPEILSTLNIPAVWQIAEQAQLVERVQKHFEHPATIVFSSEAIAEPYRRLDTRQVCRILPTTADLATIKLYKQKNSPMDLRAGFGIGKNSAVFTIAGPTIEGRGHITFVNAALELLEKQPALEMDFFIAGQRAGETLDQLKAKINASGKAERFHFVAEEADPAKRYPYYWIADVCVTCSDSEIFPMTTLEAMAFKKAVLGPDVPAINEIIENDENGFLYQAGNASDLAAKMETLAQHRDLAEALGRISLEMAMLKFALKKGAFQLERYLRESIVYQPG